MLYCYLDCIILYQDILGLNKTKSFNKQISKLNTVVKDVYCGYHLLQCVYELFFEAKLIFVCKYPEPISLDKSIVNFFHKLFRFSVNFFGKPMCKNLENVDPVNKAAMAPNHHVQSSYYQLFYLNSTSME